MFSRPAFLTQFLGRLPDARSLRFRLTGGVGLVAGSFGLLLALAAIQLDSRRCAEVARARAETLAHTAGAWLDGDSHAGLGQEPEKRLTDARATLVKVLEQSDGSAVVRTLRPKADSKAALAARPGVARPSSLEVVLRSDEGKALEVVDYLAEMEDALFESKVASTVHGGKVSAFAPVPDSWGATPAIVWVEAPASAPLWRRIAFAAGVTIFAALLVAFAVWQARRSAEGLAAEIDALEAGARQLAGGRMPGSFATRSAPSELAALADALDALRSRLGARAGGQPMAAAPQEAEPAEEPAPASSFDLGEASEFDLALLLQQLVEPARKQAHSRGVDVQLVFPDGVPSQVVGHPMPLFKTIEALLRNALRVTREGRVTVRVSRAGDSADGVKLRFEVADTSPGIAFKEQQELGASLAAAAGADPHSLQDALEAASAFSCALGGQLGFESQPGQGSRFGFTIALRASAPRAPAPSPAAAATGFQPRPTTGFQPRPTTGFQPRPATGFQPRPATAFQPRATPQQQPPQPPQPPQQPRPPQQSQPQAPPQPQRQAPPKQPPQPPRPPGHRPAVRL